VSNNKKETEISKECIFTTIASEAAGLYNLLITVSTGMFAGTLLFLEGITPSPTKDSLWFLVLGWLMLLLCTLACAWIRWKNLESGRLALEGRFEDARKVDKPNRRLTKFAIISLGLGIAFIGIFGFVNVVQKINTNESGNKMDERKNEHKKTKDKRIKFQKRAIPYGSIEPEDEEQLKSENDLNSGSNTEGKETNEPGKNSVNDN
jgi:hypothetical protein